VTQEVVDLDWRPIVRFSLILAAVGALLYLIDKTPRTFTMFAVALLLAIGLNSLVVRVQQHVHSRPLAVAITMIGVAIVFTLIFTFLIPPAVHQARQLPRQLNHVLDRITEVPVVGKKLAQAKTKDKIRSTIEALPDHLNGDLSPVRRLALSIADTLSLAVGIVLATICLLLDGTRFLDRARRFFPKDRTESAENAQEVIYASVGRYIAGSLTVAGIAGLYVLTVGLILRVPLAPLVAIWVALWDLIPQIGGAAGGIPFVVLGFTRSPLTGIICAVLFIAYLQVENNVIQPIVVGKAVKLSPLVTMLAALIGVGLGGVLGALFAVPLVGAAKALYEARAEIFPASA
jgi:predicted PurR-regulated permease PerM